MLTRAIAATAAALALVAPATCGPDDATRTCPEYEALLVEHAPAAGWDTARMSSVMYRESRCNPSAYNRAGRASGLLQVTPISYPYLRQALGEWVDRWTLADPVQNVRASAALFDYWVSAGRSGYRPWALTA